VTADHMI